MTINSLKDLYCFFINKTMYKKYSKKLGNIKILSTGFLEKCFLMVVEEDEKRGNNECRNDF